MLQSGIMDSLSIQYSTWHSRAQLRTAQRGKSLPGAITRWEYCTGNIFNGCFHIKITKGFNGYIDRLMSTLTYLSFGPAYSWYPIKFIFPECVSYLGKEGCSVWETVHISVLQCLCTI